MKRRNFTAAALVILILALCLTACAFEKGNPVSGDDSPASGNAPVPVWQFCHGIVGGLDTAVITMYATDCETGLSPAELPPEQAEWIRGIAVNGVITGKANDISLTGGTWVYTFETPAGEHLLSVEMYRGMIVAADGMYNFN